jgi:hypothetical protein
MQRMAAAVSNTDMETLHSVTLHVNTVGSHTIKTPGLRQPNELTNERHGYSRERGHW